MLGIILKEGGQSRVLTIENILKLLGRDILVKEDLVLPIKVYGKMYDRREPLISGKFADPPARFRRTNVPTRKVLFNLIPRLRSAVPIRTLLYRGLTRYPDRNTISTLIYILMYILYSANRTTNLNVYMCIIFSAEVRAIRDDMAVIECDRTTFNLLYNPLPVIVPPI